MKRLTLLLAFFLLGSALTDGKDFRHWQRLQIKSVVPEYENQKLYIFGLFFGDSPVAWLDDHPLDIKVANDNFIEAALPTLEPGTYRLLVARRISKHPHPKKMDIIDVTLGATGPEGPPGLEGPKGDKGDTGDGGDTGDPGTPGFSCWDQDMNLTCDLPSEDVNGDGACTTADCMGPEGPPGAEGAPGVSGWTTASTICSVGSNVCAVQCPHPLVVFGGGYHLDPSQSPPMLAVNEPVSNNGWRIQTIPNNVFLGGSTVFAICALRN